MSTVECYCPKSDTWKKVAPMMRYRSAGGEFIDLVKFLLDSNMCCYLQVLHHYVDLFMHWEVMMDFQFLILWKGELML